MMPTFAPESFPHCVFQGVRLHALALSLVCAMTACDRPAEPGEQPHGATAAVLAGSAGVASADTEASAEPPGEPAEASTEAAPTGEGVPPVDLQSLLRRAGFVPGEEIAVDEFVPVPPGATASAATFGRDAQQARIVAVNYPNPQYARPHVTDVLERRALLPMGGDAVLARGSQVIQLRLLDREQADELAEELRVLLQWPELVDPELLPPSR